MVFAAAWPALEMAGIASRCVGVSGGGPGCLLKAGRRHGDKGLALRGEIDKLLGSGKAPSAGVCGEDLVETHGLGGGRTVKIVSENATKICMRVLT